MALRLLLVGERQAVRADTAWDAIVSVLPTSLFVAGVRKMDFAMCVP
jgi:hypothetical protein